MKIEKLSENQIRCTLNKSDLASRQLKISELAYGSEKAKELFRDMMQQASYELGFETEDIPLMIEAIPVSADCIVLIITKVVDPEELDTRFSKFSPSYSDDDFEDFDYPYGDYETIEASDPWSELPTAGDELTASDEEAGVMSDSVADDVFNLFNKVRDYLNRGDDATEPVNTPAARPAEIPVKPQENVVRIFSFENLDILTEAARAVLPVYNDRNHLFKDSQQSGYYLVLEKDRASSVNFNKACNILSEYGTKENLPPTSFQYFKEHLSCIVKNRALQVMSKM
jgi:adapter protein MecA 1/2